MYLIGRCSAFTDDILLQSDKNRARFNFFAGQPFFCQSPLGLAAPCVDVLALFKEPFEELQLKLPPCGLGHSAKVVII